MKIYCHEIRIHTKLMGCIRPQAKYCFKSDSNCLLFDFFDPKWLLESKSSERNQFQQMKKRSKSSILDQFLSIMDKFDQLFDKD